ncbi:sulfotransferase family protein [Yinghuangia seranimata]|uniref:sulfotransferase family protein n=1 Tax=Yinghuangia seranimata TaxID=408067 RepID=UPI00248C619D|nr:sulfotransferase [Yinghuangia seranimata]MDI2129665.1 sulfotransferase [Yinghuangia seranimata]
MSQPHRERPAWVRLVNDGLAGPLADSAREPFDVEGLLGQARALTGLSDFGEGGVGGFFDDDFRTPLGLLLADLEEHADLTLVGRWQTYRFLLRLLRVRLQVVDYVKRDPGVLDEAVVEPLFVTGAPRTGTSILHALLAQDPAHRVPEGWELLTPVPPPFSDPAAYAADPRIAVADAELRFFDQVTGSLDAIHVYGARMPKECLSAHSFAFRSQEFPARYNVPNYTAWLMSCDMGPAYAWHKLTLRILQRGFPPGRRWVLKSPAHLHSLPALAEAYPDARIAVTHRDPLTVLGSVTSLVATLRWVHSDTVDYPAIGRYHADLYAGDLDALVDHSSDGVLDATRVHHSQYADFLTEPLETVRALYDALDLRWSSEASAAMRAYLEGRPKDKHGAHHYAFEDLALDRSLESARFGRYRAHFGVPAGRDV